MKLRVASDLHFEYHADHGATLVAELAAGDYDILMIAGDVSNLAGFGEAISMLCAAVAPRRVVYVLGNHEGFGGKWQQACERARQLDKRIANLTVLEQSVAVIDGQRFVGCTLWYRHSGRCEPLDDRIPDFSHIEDVRRLLPGTAKASARFLRNTVRGGDVVMTHHLPHPLSIVSRFAGSPINGYFLHDVADLVEQRQAALWIHGHTHASCDYTVGVTRVVCNPFGYVRSASGEPNPHFRSDLDLVI